MGDRDVLGRTSLSSRHPPNDPPGHGRGKRMGQVRAAANHQRDVVTDSPAKPTDDSNVIDEGTSLGGIADHEGPVIGQVEHRGCAADAHTEPDNVDLGVSRAAQRAYRGGRVASANVDPKDVWHRGHFLHTSDAGRWGTSSLHSVHRPTLDHPFA
jgi:hypothetical protein